MAAVVERRSAAHETMYSPRIERALKDAVSAHEGQLRKSKEPVPYIVHPMHVALILARWGMDEDVIVAGILHDVIEDCKEKGWSRQRLERDFGQHVADLVAEVSEDKSQGWQERKRAGIERVAHLSPSAAAIRSADALHNLATLCAELRGGEPEAVWSRFNGGREGTLAVSAELVEALCRRVEPKIARGLKAALQELLDLAGEEHAVAPTAG